MKMYKVPADMYLKVSKKNAYPLCVASTTAVFFWGTPGHFELKTHILRKNGLKSLKLSSSDLPHVTTPVMQLDFGMVYDIFLFKTRKK